ncbi:MAG: hypothetical protein ACR2PF_13345 [Rhizobiaceae bacterium]
MVAPIEEASENGLGVAPFGWGSCEAIETPLQLDMLDRGQLLFAEFEATIQEPPIRVENQRLVLLIGHGVKRIARFVTGVTCEIGSSTKPMAQHS